MRKLVTMLLMFATLTSSSFAQLARITPDKKTIEIHATDKITTPAETATVKIGFQNVAASKDAVYEENVRVANKIVQALQSAGIPAEAIETESIRWSVRTPRKESSLPSRDIPPTRNGASELGPRKRRKS